MIGIFGRAVCLKVVGVCYDRGWTGESVSKFANSGLELLRGCVAGLLIAGLLAVGCLKNGLRLKSRIA